MTASEDAGVRFALPDLPTVKCNALNGVDIRLGKAGVDRCSHRNNIGGCSGLVLDDNCIFFMLGKSDRCCWLQDAIFEYSFHGSGHGFETSWGQKHLGVRNILGSGLYCLTFAGFSDSLPPCLAHSA